MNILENERIRRILARLKPLYPEGKIFALSALDDDLRQQLNDAYADLGYPDLGSLLRELGYETISAGAVRDLRGEVLYSPGQEPEPIRSKAANMLALLKKYYPDGVVRGSMAAEHKSLYSTVSGLSMWLGYPDNTAMLEAYGYRVREAAAGRPENDYQKLIDTLLEKYADGPKPRNMGILIYENPELRGQLKTLQNKAPELFGMSLKAFFTDLGIFEDKAEAAAAKAAAAGPSKQDAALAALQKRYESSDGAHGTWEEAAESLRDLTVKQNKAGQIYVFRALRCPAALRIPWGVDFISAGAFQNETGLRSVTLPSSIRELSPDVFAGCTALEEVRLSEGLETVGDRAFAGCTALRRVELPSSVQALGKGAFAGCAALEEVEIPCLTVRLADDAFEGCPFRYEPFSDEDSTDPSQFVWTEGKKGTLILSGYRGRDAFVRVPSIVDGMPVTTVGVSAFYGNQAIRGVSLPDTVSVVQKDAFRDCAALETVHLSDAVTKIITTTFSGCTALREINIPDGVAELKHNTFRDSPIRVLRVGKGLRTLPGDTFVRYTYQSDVIGGDWRRCERTLETVRVDPANPWLRAEDSVLYSADGKTLLACLRDRQSFTIPEGVESVGESAFVDMAGLQDVRFPASLSAIRSAAFRHTGLRSIRIPGGVRQIESEAFAYAESLSSVLFEEGVEEIGDGAFDGCPIVSVLLPATVRRIGARSFSCFGSYSDKMLDFRIAEGNPWLRADGVALYQIGGEGKTLSVLYHRSYKAYSADGDDQEFAYQVEAGTTEIADDAMFECVNLKALTLPEGLLRIGRHALARTGLTELVLPASLESVGDGAFSASRSWLGGRIGLRDIRVAEGNRRFFTENGCLFACRNDGTNALVTCFGDEPLVVLPPETTELLPEAFCNSDLQEVHLPACVTTVGEGCFQGCTSLRRLRMDFRRKDGSTGSAALYLPRVEESAFSWGVPLRDQYMDCIRTDQRGGIFDFEKYDSLFESITDDRDKVLVAVDRLKSELRLAPTYAENYRRFLRRNLSAAVEVLIRENDPDGLSLLAGWPEFELKKLDGYIDLANRAGSTAAQVLLMNLKNTLVGFDLPDLDLSDFQL